MTAPDSLVILGTRATVELLPPGRDGWAWICDSCHRTAGLHPHHPDASRHLNPELPSDPFRDCEVNGRWDTAEGHCRRSATAHANNICPGPDSAGWQPTPHTHTTPTRRTR